MDFDPFSPGVLKSAFVEARPDDRAELLAEALRGMAKGLRGISAVVELAYVDPDNFLSGLTVALLENPANLTAARARIWFYIRNQRWTDAEAVYKALEQYWGGYGDLLAERIRLSIVSSGSLNASETFNKYKKCLKSYGLTAYRLQADIEQLAGDEKPLIASLLDSGASALRNLLTVPDPNAPHALKPSEFRANWKFAELVLSARTIAIVGNAPTLIGGGRGAEIDAHDLVVRCNFPSITNYVNDVGHRTSLLMVNECLRSSLLQRRHEAFSDTLIIGLHPEPQFELPTDEVFATVTDVGTIPPAVRRFLAETSYPRSTTGLMAINLISLVFNKKIDLYGFDFFSDVKRPHYYGQQVGAWLGHELQYERYYVTRFLPRILPGQIEMV